MFNKVLLYIFYRNVQFFNSNVVYYKFLRGFNSRGFVCVCVFVCTEKIVLIYKMEEFSLEFSHYFNKPSKSRTNKVLYNKFTYFRFNPSTFRSFTVHKFENHVKKNELVFLMWKNFLTNFNSYIINIIQDKWTAQYAMKNYYINFFVWLRSLNWK